MGRLCRKLNKGIGCVDQACFKVPEVIDCAAMYVDSFKPFSCDFDSWGDLTSSMEIMLREGDRDTPDFPGTFDSIISDMTLA